MACCNSVTPDAAALLVHSARTSPQSRVPAAEIAVDPHRLAELLSNPAHPAHGALTARLLQNVARNESIPNGYKAFLPLAVATIARVTPNALGLLKPAANSGPGASALRGPGKLGHRTQGAAFAAELIVAAAIIEKGSTAGNAATRLEVGLNDRVDFGIKLQASYRGANLDQPSRRTVEADCMISRPSGDVGVDVKHAAHASVYGGPVPHEQLAGIRVAILTGEIKEFHFVTNGTFSNAWKEAVSTENHRIAESLKSADDTPVDSKSPAGNPPIQGGQVDQDSSLSIFWHERVWA